MARSVLAVWAVVAAELAVVVGVCHEAVSSVWELQFGVLWLAPIVLVSSSLAGLAGGLLVGGLRRLPEKHNRVLLSIAAATFGGVVGWGVGGGRHLAALPARGGFALAVGLVAVVSAWWLGPKLAKRARTAPLRVAVVAGLVIVLAEFLNRFALVRLYPAFHAGLAAAALLVAPALTFAWSAPQAPRAGTGRRRWVLPVVVCAVVALTAALARPAAAKLAYFDNFRWLLLEQAPLLGHGVRAAAWLAPPAPSPALPEGCADWNAPGCRLEGLDRGDLGHPIDLRGRDFLLVTIDALRADHVGAYGYRRKTSPNLDALARDAMVFDYAYCPAPHTSYSITSLMTGKYMRPLLLQGAGEDSDTWAGLLRTYGYRTAGFYPPAVFFIDADRFGAFRDRFLDFEYRKVEFLEGQGRVKQVSDYLAAEDPDRRQFIWVHLFGLHEPYEAHPGFDFGDRDLDRYDSEVAAADATTGAIIREFRRLRPGGVVMVSSDHGEEFGEHGGRYHGTSVYEEQVRVPLIFSAPGAVAPGRVQEPVQIIDLLPTVLAALDIPIPPRVRGRDLGPLLRDGKGDGVGLALAETEETALLARGTLRLICQRRVGACRLYDLASDPRQSRDIASLRGPRFAELREEIRVLSASHGEFEVRGLRAEGKGWPAPILRGAAGDGDAARDIASLLDDADRSIRRKAAELLFSLRRDETASALRLALQRDEDADVRRWCALALTRLGQGAPLAYELARSNDVTWRRLAALALAEAGDPRGADDLVRWWQDAPARDYERSLELLDALAKIRNRDAVWPLVQTLHDVRLRPHIAKALAAIGDDVARGPLGNAFAKERYQSARVAVGEALVELGAEAEIAPALTRFLGVPDPLPGGVGMALRAGILEHVGGPNGGALRRLRQHSELGSAVNLVVPRGGNGKGVRAIVRARTSDRSAGQVVVGNRLQKIRFDSEGKPRRTRGIPRLDPERSVKLLVPPGDAPTEVYALVPAAMGLSPGQSVQVVVFADRSVEIEALALVPLADEIPPPAPEPWEPGQGGGAGQSARGEVR